MKSSLLVLLIGCSASAMEQNTLSLNALPSDIHKKVITSLVKVNVDHTQACRDIKAMSLVSKLFKTLLTLPFLGGKLVRKSNKRFGVNKIKAATDINQPGAYQWLKDNPQESSPARLNQGVSQLLSNTADTHRIKKINKISQFFSFALSAPNAVLKLITYSGTQANYDNVSYLMNAPLSNENGQKALNKALGHCTMRTEDSYLRDNRGTITEQIKIVDALLKKFPEAENHLEGQARNQLDNYFYKNKKRLAYLEQKNS